MNILLIQNDPVGTGVIQNMLHENGSNGCRLHSASHLNQGLDVMNSFRIDAILLDSCLPDCCGLDALHHINSVNQMVPVVVISGSADQETAIASISQGACEYLVKERMDGTVLWRSLLKAMKLKRAENQNRFSAGMVGLLNSTGDFKEQVRQILVLFKDFSRCEAAGLRLYDGADYPYYMTEGFAAGHEEVENSLLHHDRHGKLQIDPAGQPVLECRCGSIIRGRFDPSLPFFTPNGSFWINSADDMGGKSACVKARNWCQEEGYQSILLIPLRVGERNVGLLQLNGRRTGCFDQETVHFIESMARSIDMLLARRQAERERVASEEKFHAILETMNEAYYELDLQGNFTFFNDGFCRNLGYSKAELKGTNYKDFTPPEYRRQAEKLGHEVYRKGRPHLLTDFVNIRKDGSRIILESSLLPVRNMRGDIIGFQGIARDITARRLAEEELRQRALLLDSAYDSILAYDMEGNIFYANESACLSRGYTLEEITGMNISQLVAKAEAADVEARLKSVQKEKELVFEAVHRKKGGACFPVESRLRTIEIDGRDCVIAVYRDISDRHRAEEDLRTSYLTLKKTLEDSITTMSRIVEMRDPYTAGHQQRVARLATAIAAEIEMDAEHIHQLHMAASVHDIGKLYVPSDILSKPGKLNTIELQMIRAHARGSYDILKGIEFPFPLAAIVRQHHERLDGSGYPDGLKGDAILFDARILAVADVVEAMASHRPYRPALGLDKALEQIKRDRGFLFDRQVVDACISVFEQGFSF